MTINRFEDLIAWQKARRLVTAVYPLACSKIGHRLVNPLGIFPGLSHAPLLGGVAHDLTGLNLRLKRVNELWPSRHTRLA
jgi:hypothetical protein